VQYNNKRLSATSALCDKRTVRLQDVACDVVASHGAGEQSTMRLAQCAQCDDKRSV